MFHYNFKLYLFSLFRKFIFFLIVSFKKLWIITPNYGMTPNYKLGMTWKEAPVALH